MGSQNDHQFGEVVIVVEADQIPMIDEDPPSRHIRNSVLRGLDAAEIVRLLPVGREAHVPP